MTTQKTVQQLLDEHIAAGHLTHEQADDILEAPRWSFSMQEALYYLAGVIIAVGVVRLFIAVLEDASEISISSFLYVVAVAFAGVAWWAEKGAEIRRRFGEVCELASELSAAFATGVLVTYLWTESEWTGIAIGSVFFVFGFWRARHTDFAGSLTIIPSALVVAGMVGGLLDLREPNDALTLMAGAIVLILVSLTGVHFSLAPRVAGSAFLIGTTTGWVGMHQGGWAAALAIIGAAVMFFYGARMLLLDMLVSAGIIITASVAIVSFNTFDNQVLQGVVVIVVGVAMLAVTMPYARRRKTL
jgi:hypothetical protein